MYVLIVSQLCHRTDKHALQLCAHTLPAYFVEQGLSYLLRQIWDSSTTASNIFVNVKSRLCPIAIMTADGGGINVQVKWQKEMFDVTIDTTQPAAVFKAQMFALTGVQPDRQKIMVKGGMLKDDADWAPLGIKPGQKLMMMGSRDEAPQAPKNAPLFVEDLPEEEQDVTGMAKYGAGLENLGNTCYMNSTMQYLYAVPELRNELRSYPSDPQGTVPAGPARLAHRLTLAIKNLFASMEKSALPVTPYPFLTLLREKYPQFAEQEAGIYKQQDAEECYTQIVWTLRECLHLVRSS